MAEQENEAPKIIVDDDWKTQAQAEKAKLAAEAKQTEESKEADQPSGKGAQRELPPANFVSLVSMMATQAIMALGGMQDPKEGKVMVDPELSKHYIDTLAVLEEKTKGNLADDEAKTLEEALYHTRMMYVEINKRMTEAMKAGNVGPAAGDAPQA